ncbi:hypothetical protein [Mycolicibacterium parafortuitum]|uniref:SRPBCC family protein n=1 Tax=Mycolicibacterium parafortuitum TaxID=39692 RepID=A0A375YIX3_MYCPF|nr:hypothetical protein [Mycolicibacterium parafortuitum]ORB32347.1 hypothetical protein BST38_01180 [Mycolicibacterium parafortuitum]SRX81043.1 hypothetical protein [Propionibacterium acidipropionici ATCC 4875] [Mycolicibacterium parafortuitum]
MNRYRAVVAGTAAAALVIAYRTRLRPWIYRWGATHEESVAGLPGDELVAGGARTTRAVTIDAGPEDVWPWLAQIGEDRGGFYSYSGLERAVGADIHNATTVHPEWQDLAVGDTVWLARRGGDRGRQVVAALEPKSHLVLMSPDDYARVQRGEKASGSWSFHLKPTGTGTRLLARGNGGYGGNVLYDIVHFVMERRMLLGVRERAERATAWSAGRSA